MPITLQEHIFLKPYTTMRTGGPARFFVVVNTIDDIKEAFMIARSKALPVFVLGGGSNVLIADSGFDGLVMKIELHGKEYKEVDDYVEGIFSAGEVWDSVVSEVVERGLWGIENLSLVPGTVGGGVVQNIGAYGVELCDSVMWVEALNTRTQEIKKFALPECEFSYRSSFFKKNPEWVVLRVSIKLSRIPAPHTDYEDVRKYFSEHNIPSPTLADIRNAVVAIRTLKLPGREQGTAGSFFKNPIISLVQLASIKKHYPEIKTYPVSGAEIKVSAAWLIDHVGNFRGAKRGDVGVHERQALILVNNGNGTSEEIKNLAEEIKSNIFEKTKILLEEEVVLVN